MSVMVENCIVPTKQAVQAPHGDQLAAIIIYAVGTVVGFRYDRRKGGTRECQIHLVTDLLETKLGVGCLTMGFRSQSIVTVFIDGYGIAGLDDGRCIHLLDDSALKGTADGQALAAVNRRIVPRTCEANLSSGRPRRFERSARAAGSGTCGSKFGQTPMTDVFRFTRFARISGNSTWNRLKYAVSNMRCISSFGVSSDGQDGDECVCQINYIGAV